MSTRLFTLAAAAGPAALALGTTVMLALAPAGRHPLWAPERFNMTEAAAARDVATIAAMLERGDDPNVARPIRPPLPGAGVGRSLTPIEAGVLARRGEVVALLLMRGARPADADRARLVCQALHNGDREIAESLGGAAEGSTCAP